MREATLSLAYGPKPRSLGIDTSLDLYFEVLLNDLFGYRHLRLLVLDSCEFFDRF